MENASKANNEAEFNSLKAKLEQKISRLESKTQELQQRLAKSNEPEAQQAKADIADIGKSIKTYATWIKDTYTQYKSKFNPPRTEVEGEKSKIKQKIESAKTKVKGWGEKIKTKVKNKLKSNKSKSPSPSKTAGIKQKFKASKAKATKLIKMGIPVPQLQIMITALQGRLYWRMSHDIENGILKGAIDRSKNHVKNANSRNQADASIFDQFSLPAYPSDETTMDYLPDESASFGIMVMAQIKDLPTGGNIAEAYGAVEVVFSNSGGLKEIGAECEGKFGNLSVPLLNGDPLASVYTKWTFDWKAKRVRFDVLGKTSKNLCAMFDAHGEISPEKIHFAVGSKHRPVVAVFGPCVGPKLKAFFEFYNNNRGNQTYVELGGGVGFYVGWRGEVSLPSNNFIRAEAGLDVEIGNFATKLWLRPDVKIDYVEVGFRIHASVRITWDIPGGWLVPDKIEKGSKSMGLLVKGNAGVYSNGNDYRAKGRASVCVKISKYSKCIGKSFDISL